MQVVKNINEYIFKPYDIRGKYQEEIDKNVAYTIGKSYGTFIKRNGEKNCVVGYDNRYSSIELSVSLILGMLSTGIDVINLGLVTTPMCLYAKELMKCNCYMMVTASHNPKDDNGFKFSVDKNGNARGKVIEDFKKFTLAGNFDSGIGQIKTVNIKNDYIDLFKRGINLGNKRIKVVLDLANGTTTCIARDIYEMFDIDLTIINEKSDSSFPNHHPDPAVRENQSQLIQKVIEIKADIGIGFDGDGDRVGVVDEKGNIISADTFMAIVSKSILENNYDKRVLYDVKCSNQLRDEIEKLGGTPICYRTGASYTMAKVIDDNILIGGEYSGHIYFNDRVPVTGSGLYSGLRMIEVLSKTNETLSELTDKLNKYYNTDEIKIPSPNEKKENVINLIKDYCQKLGIKYDGTDGLRIERNNGWALIRTSNTTPNITARFEATSEEGLISLKREFINLINYFNK